MTVPPTVKQITIDASPDKVWLALTDRSLMPKWMSEDDAGGMEIVTNWQVNQSIVIEGRWHKMRYRNVGIVLQFDPGRTLSYSHLSSLSRLPDILENHSVLTFTLEPVSRKTLLRLTLSHSPTLTIHKHLDLYWNVTLDELRRFVEHQLAG
jgi:uncharacterized protein YndB with AHSA1/START domain